MWKNTCFLFSCIHWKSKCYPNKYRVKIEHESLQNVIYKASFFYYIHRHKRFFVFFFFPSTVFWFFFFKKNFWLVVQQQGQKCLSDSKGSENLQIKAHHSARLFCVWIPSTAQKPAVRA